MSKILFISLAYLLAYLIGGFPTSAIAGKLKGIDITKHGSGNVGATNALRVLGTKIGVTVMLVDTLKGAGVILLGRWIISSFASVEPNQVYDLTIGITGILGHVFSIYLKFKGGKGVATAAGVYTLLSPLALLISVIVFVTTIYYSRYVSLGSIVAAVVLAVSQLVVNLQNDFAELPMLIMTVLLAIFIILKHKQNIKRLLAGNENKISFKK